MTILCVRDKLSRSKQGKTKRTNELRIGVIGAGFSGTAFAATLNKLAKTSAKIYLFDKAGCFGRGDPYCSPYPFHLLNVRAEDMSAFEEDRRDFIVWLESNSHAHAYLGNTSSIGHEFVPRFLYGDYLEYLLDAMTHSANKTQLVKEAVEVIDAIPTADAINLVLSDGRTIEVDKVIIATGNIPSSLPFQPNAESKINYIHSPWNFSAAAQIPSSDTVMIVGTGLTMVDTVLTLYHQQHAGKIYAISRHGLLPLPHAELKAAPYIFSEIWPNNLRGLLHYFRNKSKAYMQTAGDWRMLVNTIRQHLPTLWQQANVADKKRFLRHVLPYWNIHRHRVHNKIADLLYQLMEEKKLQVISGRIKQVNNDHVHIRERQSQVEKQIKINWMINCIGPGLINKQGNSRLIDSLIKQQIATVDSLELGFKVTNDCALINSAGQSSSQFYALGQTTKGTFWECTAVPEIRKQCFNLVTHLFK